jgi:uncharacterized membrane protein
MPVPLDFLRGVLGVLAILFAHVLGRSIVRVRRGMIRSRSLYGWVIRTLLCAAAVLWRRGFDGISISVLVVAAASLALGAWQEQRPKKQEDLKIFGE